MTIKLSDSKIVREYSSPLAELSQGVYKVCYAMDGNQGVITLAVMGPGLQNGKYYTESHDDTIWAATLATILQGVYDAGREEQAKRVREVLGIASIGPTWGSQPNARIVELS